MIENLETEFINICTDFELGMDLSSMLLSKNEVIAIPTDTVYGLICSINSISAIQRIYTIKHRSIKKPLVVFCKSIKEIEDLCIDIPNIFYKLTEKYLPGPLTLVLKKSSIVPETVTCGMETIAVRIPDYDFLNKLLNKLDYPLASTSANLSDNKSLVIASDVLNSFSGQIPLVIDGGKCPLSIESTIIDISGKDVKILREGVIKKIELIDYLNK